MTPLHFDSYDNLFAQVSRRFTRSLYPWRLVRRTPPPGPGLCGPVLWLIFLSIWPQVVGTKYVRLYAPSETPKLYVRGAEAGGLCAQGNMSEVDVEAPDLDRHPRFVDAAYEEVVMRPGEMLFIPAGTWHYVRSLSTSWSISFWF